MQVADRLTTTAAWAQTVVLDGIDEDARTHRAAGLWTQEQREALQTARNSVAALFGAEVSQ